MGTTTVAKDLEEAIRPVTNKIYDSLLSKSVYRTEIDRIEPKLWRFTCVSLILAHPVVIVID